MLPRKDNAGGMSGQETHQMKANKNRYRDTSKRP
jgi:hypothetical protein